uniref:pentatricopeptide repeat-containing protein At5g09450, mitochondrial isoform X2 n=1 Tax=Erigeron canadensis TaxID=72917 RepID=UPI001CB9A7D0|nr:pentatricopeptide repeat-containing protein At5g09450, mitochondrial isoform X2 [Erigeron canadensis]
MAAARSLFTGFIRNHKKTNGLVQRFTSSVVTKPEMGPEDDPDYSGGSDLRSRIFRLRLPKRSATNVIEKWVNEGNQITIHDLRQISKELRKEHRFKHALELSEWMVSRGEFELSDSDYAFRIDLMAKVFDKAEDLYERMKESNIPLSAMIYNELMTLYTSVGLAEKVSLVVEEMKKQNVSPDIYTYNLLISSCASALQIDDVRNILDEMAARELGPSESWARYVNLVKIYLTSGQLVDSKVNSVVEIEKGITQREWITYDFLIILHCALGNKDTLDRIWRSLKMTNQKMISRNYACILSAYLMLGHFNKVDEVISQWKTSATTDFDMSVCDRLTNAFEEVGMNEKASSFRVLLRDM